MSYREMLRRRRTGLVSTAVMFTLVVGLLPLPAFAGAEALGEDASAVKHFPRTHRDAETPIESPHQSDRDTYDASSTEEP